MLSTFLQLWGAVLSTLKAFNYTHTPSDVDTALASRLRTVLEIPFTDVKTILARGL